MSIQTTDQPLTAIACGGTGGHLFPGLAVAERLLEEGGRVLLLVSAKGVDQQVIKSIRKMEVLTLPAVGLSRGGAVNFAQGLLRSYRAARGRFKTDPPRAALAMGGFTSVGPTLAARLGGAPVFLHESNSIPGRANRWLSWLAAEAFTAFPSAAAGLHSAKVTTYGTPVRRQFLPLDSARARAQLGLDGGRPVLLIMGGSQGAAGINELVLRALPLLAQWMPELQYLHLSGSGEFESVRAAYGLLKLTGVTYPFLEAMEVALSAATVAVSRAGGSSLAELAAMQVPSVLIPYPQAVEDHQLHNARAWEYSSAAIMLEQRSATPESLARTVQGLLTSSDRRDQIRRALKRWQAPRAADQIAQVLLEAMTAGKLSAIDASRVGRQVGVSGGHASGESRVSGAKSQPAGSAASSSQPLPVVSPGDPAPSDPANRLERVVA